MIFVYFVLGYFAVGTLYWMKNLYHISKTNPEGYETWMYRWRNYPMKIKILTMIRLASKWSIYVYRDVRDYIPLLQLYLDAYLVRRRVKKLVKEIARSKGLA